MELDPSLPPPTVTTLEDETAVVLRPQRVAAAVTGLLGLLLAAAATRVMAGLLFGLSPLDPVTFGVMSGVFVVVALLASYLPARRAAAADLMVVLRAG